MRWAHEALGRGVGEGTETADPDARMRFSSSWRLTVRARLLRLGCRRRNRDSITLRLLLRVLLAIEPPDVVLRLPRVFAGRAHPLDLFGHGRFQAVIEGSDGFLMIRGGQLVDSKTLRGIGDVSPGTPDQMGLQRADMARDRDPGLGLVRHPVGPDKHAFKAGILVGGRWEAARELGGQAIPGAGQGTH